MIQTKLSKGTLMGSEGLMLQDWWVTKLLEIWDLLRTSGQIDSKDLSHQ